MTTLLSLFVGVSPAGTSHPLRQGVKPYGKYWLPYVLRHFGAELFEDADEIRRLAREEVSEPLQPVEHIQRRGLRAKVGIRHEVEFAEPGRTGDTPHGALYVLKGTGPGPVGVDDVQHTGVLTAEQA